MLVPLFETQAPPEKSQITSSEKKSYKIVGV